MNHSGNPGLVATWQINRPRAVAFIAKMLREADGNVTRAASALKVTRRSLHRWMQEEPSLRKEARAIKQAKKSRKGK
jgi:hypothetical protein